MEIPLDVRKRKTQKGYLGGNNMGGVAREAKGSLLTEFLVSVVWTSVVGDGGMASSYYFGTAKPTD